MDSYWFVDPRLVGYLLAGIGIGILLVITVAKGASNVLAAETTHRKIVGTGGIGIVTGISIVFYGVLPSGISDGIALGSIAVLGLGTGILIASGIDSRDDAVWNGLLAGCFAGVLFTFIAADQALSTQPPLTLTVLWSAIIAPPLLGLCTVVGVKIVHFGKPDDMGGETIDNQTLDSEY